MFSQEPPSQQWHGNLEGLQKAIREQKLVLDTLTDVNSSRQDVEDIKQRIVSVSRELHQKQAEALHRGRLNNNSAQWWSRYEQNMRQLETIADERRTLEKEIDYLIYTSIRNLERDIQQETETLHRLTSSDDPIRAKAQAMSTRFNTVDSDPSSRLYQLMDQIRQNERDMQSIIQRDLTPIDQAIYQGTKELREQQMFEKGLYVDDQVAQWIDSINKTPLTVSTTRSPRIPSLPSKLAPPPPPPPVPTSQRPGTPRSEADIKAEAHRRIEERRRLFMKEIKTIPAVPAPSISQEEKAAQQKMRQAELEARARLEVMREKRNKLRRETEEAEERKQQAAKTTVAAAEADMAAEKQKEEEARVAIQREQEAEQRELIKQQLEKEVRQKQEMEERMAEEERQKRAREAAEQAAHEKRMRRKEIERREREMQAARQEELDRRRRWEEQEQQRRKEQEEQKRREEEEEMRLQRILEEEKRRLEEQARLEEQRQLRRRKESELRKKREEEDKRKEEERKRKQKEEEERKRQEEERKRQEEERKRQEEEEERSRALEMAVFASSPASIHSRLPDSTTAGTSGYGVDIEDEVNFNTIYRVNTLYEYQGIREDDLSFSANETLKAHPSKDKASDWWYGTSLKNNQMGFFPRTYVEVVEEAFRVRTLYEFKKSRDDDLGFSENEVILVQPFQDENSDWWYGTNEETEESGYFPKTYVEKIHPASTNDYTSPTSFSSPISIPSNKNQSYLENDQLAVMDLHRGLSAPNTPIMKKTNLSINKTELTKRRRAASSVSTAEHSRISTPQLMLPQAEHPSENLELLTWASTMDPIELEAIAPEERKRQEAIFELIATERTYLSNLQMIVNVFYTESGNYLSQDERDVVFSNIDDLLMCNTALLSDMETRQKEQANVIDMIGDIFLQHADGLKCYSSYCRNQSYATKFLQKKREEDQWFEVFLKTAQTRPECRSLDLSHYLLQPVQRITRYPLLLRQILNSTPKKHPDHSLVRSSLSIAQRILEDVNEETRRYENRQKIQELSRILDMESIGRLDVSGREFVMDSPLFKAKSGRKLHGFLFNDILILAEPLKSLSPKGYLYTLYREPMALDKISVRQQQTMTMKPSFGTNNSDDLGFQIVTGTHVTAVKTSTVTLKRQWMSQIQHYSALQQYK